MERLCSNQSPFLQILQPPAVEISEERAAINRLVLESLQPQENLLQILSEPPFVEISGGKVLINELIQDILQQSWDSTNNIDIPEIDAIHRKIFQQAVRLKQITSKSNLADFKNEIKFLLNLVEKHYKIEQEKLESKNGPNFLPYEESYAEFLDRFLNQKKFTNLNDERRTAYELAYLVAEWVIQHSREDAQWFNPSKDSFKKS